MSENRRGEGKRCVYDCECLYVKAASSGRTQGNFTSSDGFLLINSWFLICSFLFFILSCLTRIYHSISKPFPAQWSPAKEKRHDFQRISISSLWIKRWEFLPGSSPTGSKVIFPLGFNLVSSGTQTQVLLGSKSR